MKKNPIKLIFLSMLVHLSISLFACSSNQPKPNLADVQARLLVIQSDLATIAASPATQTAITIGATAAGIAETAVGAPELVPETVQAAAALKAVNTAISANSRKLPDSNPAATPVPVQAVPTVPIAPSLFLLPTPST